MRHRCVGGLFAKGTMRERQQSRAAPQRNGAGKTASTGQPLSTYLLSSVPTSFFHLSLLSLVVLRTHCSSHLARGSFHSSDIVLGWTSHAAPQLQPGRPRKASATQGRQKRGRERDSLLHSSERQQKGKKKRKKRGGWGGWEGHKSRKESAWFSQRKASAREREKV